MCIAAPNSCRIIVTADDFGRSTPVNAAVIRAHRQGVLTSASLMITGAACDDAVALARQTPSLAVGLHLVLTDASAASPGAGQLPRDPLWAGLHLLRRNPAPNRS